MSDRAHSTLEPLQNQDNQPGLEIDPRTSPPAYESPKYKEDFGHGERQILGFQRRRFIPIAVLVIILIVGAIVGGAVGGKLAKQKQLPIPGPTPTTPPPPSLSTTLEKSSIASVNWTDGTYQHHAIFYHHSDLDHISLSLWDEKNRTWFTSQVVANGAPPPQIGTSIATSVNVSPGTFRLSVYFYAIGTNAVEMFTSDQQARMGNWQRGPNYIFTGFADSKLAAYYQQCGLNSCPNSTIVVYQDPDRKIRSWSAGQTPVNVDISHPAGERTGLGLMPYIENENDTDSLRLYIQTEDQMQEYIGRGWTYWNLDSEFGPSSRKPSLKTPSKITAIPLTNSTGGLEIIVVSLSSTQVLQSLRHVHTGWREPTSPALDGTIGNFTDIAMNHNRRFYGISSGKIHEFEISGDVEKWNYVGIVNTTGA